MVKRIVILQGHPDAVLSRFATGYLLKIGTPLRRVAPHTMCAEARAPDQFPCGWRGERGGTIGLSDWPQIVRALSQIPTLPPLDAGGCLRALRRLPEKRGIRRGLAGKESWN